MPTNDSEARQIFGIINEFIDVPTAKKITTRLYEQVGQHTDNESLATEAGKYANTIFHPVSTCRMGNDGGAVVNDRLKAHGLENLRIVDASVMPHITSGNTNAPTIMIAEKASDMIIEDSKI